MITVKVKRIVEIRNLGLFFIAGLLVPAFLAFIDEGNYSISLSQVFSIDFLGLFLFTGIPCMGAMIIIHEYLSHRMNEGRALLISIFGGILSASLLLAVIITSMFYLVRLIH